MKHKRCLPKLKTMKIQLSGDNRSKFILQNIIFAFSIRFIPFDTRFSMDVVWFMNNGFLRTIK